MSCSKTGVDVSGEPSSIKGRGNNSGSAGVLTAGEWSDLNHWNLWTQILANQDLAKFAGNWKFQTRNRIAVRVNNDQNNPLKNVRLELYQEGIEKPLWISRTNNLGEANCWPDAFDGQTQFDPSKFFITIDGIKQEGTPRFFPKDFKENPDTTHKNDIVPDSLYNTYTIPGNTVKNIADIAFIVDATGSMTDEILFLQADLKNIIDNVAEKSQTPLRTAAVFYRDRGDEYVTRMSPFAASFDITRKFIASQYAEGGGDSPEALEEALRTALLDLDWSNDAKARIAFLILDAPCHSDPESIETLKVAVRGFAEQGIVIIPVAASGIDKPAELLFRTLSILTNGTYVFLTDDSGVGEHHIEATVGSYQVEKLNTLLERLIRAYTE